MIKVHGRDQGSWSRSRFMVTVNVHGHGQQCYTENCPLAVAQLWFHISPPNLAV